MKIRAILFCTGVLFFSLVYAVITNFTYTAATSWDNGAPIQSGDIISTRLYCNDTMVDAHLGAIGAFSPDLPDGTYDCYAVHMYNNPQGLLSFGLRSNVVTTVVGVGSVIGAPTLTVN